MDANTSENQLEEIFGKKVDELVPVELLDLFQNEVNTLVSQTRERIRLKKQVAPEQEIKIDEEVIMTIRRWVRETSIELTAKESYPRYVKFMQKLGRKPTSLKLYISPRVQGQEHGEAGRHRPYELFQHIEDNCFGIGVMVKPNSDSYIGNADKDAPLTIVNICIDCTLWLRKKSGFVIKCVKPIFYNIY